MNEAETVYNDFCFYHMAWRGLDSRALWFFIANCIMRSKHCYTFSPSSGRKLKALNYSFRKDTAKLIH